MLKTMHTLLMIMSLFAMNSCQAPDPVSIVTNGTAKCLIVTPAKASPAESHAAKVLQDYIKRMSGASLSIVNEDGVKQGSNAVYIGHTGYAEKYSLGKLPAESYFIGSDNANICIIGGSGKGVVYGVYGLLEKFGCRKYADVPAYVPSAKNLTLPKQLHEQHTPAFIYRESYYPASLDKEYLEWHGLHQLEDLWGMWGHSFFKIVPPKTYFATHPEYYALVNGKRQATQLCLSNEAVFNITVDYMRKAIAANPDAIYWSIAAEDGGGFCTCDQCAKINAEEGGPQGTLIRFVNRVAKQFPQQQFTTLAYAYTARPPLKTKPVENVYVMLSDIDAYRDEPLSSAPSAAAFRKNLEGWSALTGHLFLWDYTTQFTNYLAPFPDYNNLQPNLQYLSAHGIKGVFSQGSGETFSDMAAFNSYLQAKLLWDPAVDADKVKADFMDGYYGKAGPYISRYLDTLTAIMHATKTRLDIYGNPVNNYKNYLSPEAIDRYSSLLDQAEKAVDGNATYTQRVAIARLPLEYTVLQQSRFFGTEKYGYLQAAGSGYEVNPRWPDRVHRFVALCKQAGVKEMSEGGGNADDYQKDWDEIFGQKWVNSLAFGAKVTLVNPPAEDYPAKGPRTLTDGLFGGKDFSINWLFIYGKDLVATIDLGQAKALQQVQLNFLQDARHYIFNPSDIIIETSADGVTFKPAGQQAVAPLADEDYTATIKHYEFKLPAVQARYVRVTGKCLSAVPLWRGADAGKKPSLCCDEVIVL
jgi:hypothetical protein